MANNNNSPDPIEENLSESDNSDKILDDTLDRAGDGDDDDGQENSNFLAGGRSLQPGNQSNEGGLGWAETFLQFLGLGLGMDETGKTFGGNFQQRNFQSVLPLAACYTRCTGLYINCLVSSVFSSYQNFI